MSKTVPKSHYRDWKGEQDYQVSSAVKSIIYSRVIRRILKIFTLEFNELF
jgi:hypothetical protein